MYNYKKGRSVIGREGNFKNGTIYWSAKTGPWAVYGDLHESYNKVYGGPNGGLGFPTSNQQDSPLKKYAFNNFENGVLAMNKVNKTMNVFTKAAVIVQRLQTDEGDDDLFVNSSVTLSVGGRELGKFNKNFGEYSNQGTVDFPRGNDDGKICDFSIIDGNMIVKVDMTAWEIDGNGNGNDLIASFSKSFGIDTFWDAGQPDLSGKQPGDFYSGPDGKFRSQFKIDKFKEINPNDWGNFRRDLWWDIHNYGTEPLAKEDYAATFSDVDESDFIPFHIFNGIFFELVYKSLAGPGICFGMCLEAIYALKGRSVSEQYISKYNDQYDGRYGRQNPKSNPFPDPTRNNNFKLRHGYQVSGEMIQYYISQLFDGEIWNPVLSFHRSREMFQRGDYPIIVMSKSATGFSDGGHAVLPYKWDDSNPRKLIIYVANPNGPISEGTAADSGMNIITIFNENNRIEFTYENGTNEDGTKDVWTGRHGEFKGGRMFPIPYSKLSTEPRTPAFEIGVALLALTPLLLLGVGFLLIPLGFLSAITGGALILFGNTTDANQITDGEGRTYFDKEDGSVVQDPSKRIDNLAHVPGVGANTPASKPRFFVNRTPLSTEPIYAGNSDKKSVLSDKWTYPHLATAVNSKVFWKASTMENVGQQFEKAVSTNIVDLVKRTAGKGTLHYDMANKGNADYEWLLSTRHGKFKIDTNSVADNSDKITIEGINSAGQALSFVPNNAREGKKLKVSITNHNNSLMFVLDKMKVAAGEPITFQHTNGGKKILVFNSNNETQADVSLTYKTNVVGNINLGRTSLAANSITTFEVLSPTTIQKEVYTELGGKPISSVGYANMSLDCRGLAHEWLVITNSQTGENQIATNPPTNMGDSGGWVFCKNRIVNFLMVDGSYSIALQSGNLSIVNFTVKNGIVDYNPELEGIISGKGTSTLVLRGLPITVDATATTGFLIYIPGVYGMDGFDTSNANRPLFTGNFLPNAHDATDGWEYWFNIDSGVVASFTFKVCIDGTVSYKPDFDGSVTGRGTNVLKILKFSPR